jgi:hypothetical protein
MWQEQKWTSGTGYPDRRWPVRSFLDADGHAGGEQVRPFGDHPKGSDCDAVGTASWYRAAIAPVL